MVLRDGVVDTDTVRRWAAEVDALDAADRLTPKGMGRTAVVQPDLRGDRTTWLGDHAEARLPGLQELFLGVREELNQAAWLGLRAFTVQLAVFPGDGARYVAHRDALAGDPARRATAIVYLNPDWRTEDGGCLRVRLPEGTRDVEPVGGRLVVFLSDRVEHEVLPSFAVRRAATAWFRGPEGVLP
jgi:SM-20-related protein